MMNEEEAARLIAHFDTVGTTEVRMLFDDHRFNHQVGTVAVKWLVQKDQDAARLEATSHAEMAATASRAATAAERAATAAEAQARTAKHALITAIAATAVAAIALIVSMAVAFHVFR